MRKNKKIISLLILMLMIVGVFATDKLSVFAEIGQNDFDVNTEWKMSGDITTGYTVKNGNRAYSTGKAKIGDIGVTATFVKQADRNDGASYLSANGNNQAAYGATSNMFYGNPDPASIPALGMNTQPSNGCGGPLGSWQKYNADGEYEVGSVTFKFAKKVTDPILDLSGLGGYVSRVGSYNYNGNMILVGMGSFNTTNLHLATKGITLENVASNSNLTTDNNIIKVKDRNTHTRAIVDNGGYNWIQFKDGYGRQYDVNSPALVPAGTGSVKLKGTFDEVTFKLYHQATPYSKFSQEKYKTHSSYFANHAGADPSHGDGINGMNVINTESVKIGGQLFNGDQNWDLFRASLRLLKPSSIGDRVWLDENSNGIQDAGEKGVAGVTVKLLDKDGNPVKDFNGNPVADQVTDANGNYKFENLAAGEYVVQVVPNEGQTLTIKGQGTADTDSNVDPATGKTDVITLEPNTNITNVDAGIVPAKEYKVDYEFQPSKAEGTPEKLPEEVLKQLPEAKEKLKDGSEVPSPKEFTPVKDEVNKGTWTFEAWDKETATINGANEHVTGTWVFTKDPVKEYKLDYEFKPSDAEGTPKTLPEGVLKQLPEAKEKLADGTEVPSPKEFTEVKDEVNKGTWTFEAWDKETAKINGADEHVTGTWVFTKDPVKEYKLDYEFQPSKAEGTPDKLPQGVLDQLPEAKEKLADGTEVPSPKEFTEVKDEVNKGTWTFEAWDKETAKINGADEHVTGTWKFTPAEEKGNVYVKYVDDKGNVLEEQSVVKKDAPVGEDYTTEQKTFKGYTFKEMDKTSAPKEGKVTKEDQTVIYVYTKDTTPEPETDKGNVYVKYVDDKGNVLEEQSVVKKDAPVGEDYTTEQKTFDGYEFVKLEDGSAPANGEVKKGDQHVTYVYKKKEVTPPTDVVTEYVDENGKTIAPQENGTKDKKDIDGYEFVRTEKDEQGNTSHIYKKKTTPPTTEVVTKYVDENGNPLALEEKGKQNKKDIPAYEYVKTYKDKDGNTVHVYRLKQNPTPSVETRYVDENGNQLLPPKEGTKDPVTIEGYNFIITSKDKNGNTIHTYSKKPTEGVETRFVDTHGNQILADKTGTHDSSLINGYEFVRTEKDEQGNTTHIYRKLPTPSKEVVTKFIDENGLELSNPLTGRNPSKAIPGYEIVRTETDSNGNIIYVYRKKASESEKITKFVDENGKEISKSTKGDNPKKDIDGYEFVRTEKDEQGNTKHIYKKKVTPPAEEKGNVYVKYVTEDGKELEAESEVLVNAEVGTKYTTDKKTFDGYEFVEMAKDSAPANGKVVKGDQHVTYVYKKTKVNPDPKPNTGNVYVQYVTEDGRILSERVVKRNAPVGENYYTDLKSFDGFRFIGMGRNSADTDGKVVEGNLYVTYVYEEIDKHDSTFPSGQNRHHDKGTPVVTIVENSDRVISTIETTEVKERQEELNNNKELNATDKTTDKVEKSEGLNAEDKKESTNNENDYVENYEEEFVEKNKSVNDGNKAPKTQDPGIALYTGLAVASSALLGLFEVKRRKNK